MRVFLKHKFPIITLCFFTHALIVLQITAIPFAAEEASEKPEDWDQRLEMLRSVPYLAFSKTEVAAHDTGVVWHIPEKTYPGYNFYNTLSSGIALLLDMDGRERHRWVFPPKLQDKSGEDSAFLLSNGDIMAIRPGPELIRINWNSQLLWRKRIAAHHDVAQAPDGTFYVLTNEKREHRGLRVNFCGIAHLTEEGEEIDRWSTFENLANLKEDLDSRSFLDTILDSVRAGWAPEGHELDEIKAAMKPGLHHYDYFHMNTVAVLSPSGIERVDDRFQRGNLLVCFRNVNQIAVLEKDTYRVLWAWGEGELQWPHHPTMLENGHILIFDNGVKRLHSRVVELDPVAEEIVWQYTADPPEQFFSHHRGSAQRLPNGNTLVCESDKGRVFEVDLAGEMMWVWRNPKTERARPEGVYRMIRHSGYLVESLLERAGGWEF
jgi:hypothetical protein